MPSYQERSQILKALSEQQYFDALSKRAKDKNKDVQIGSQKGDTGRYEVYHADGGISSNGVKTFNAANPSDGFVRGIKGGNSIALDHKNIKNQPFVIPQQSIFNNKSLKFCLSNLTGSGQFLYVGGDRSTPEVIFDRDAYYGTETENIGYVIPTFRATGIGLDDWILDLRVGRDLDTAPSGYSYYKNIDYLTVTSSGVTLLTQIFSNTSSDADLGFYYRCITDNRPSDAGAITISDYYSKGHGFFGFNGLASVAPFGHYGYAASYCVNNQTNFLSTIQRIACTFSTPIYQVNCYLSDTNIIQSNTVNNTDVPQGAYASFAMGVNQSSLLVLATDDGVFNTFPPNIRLYPDPTQTSYTSFSLDSLTDPDTEWNLLSGFNIGAGIGAGKYFANLIGNKGYTLINRSGDYTFDITQDGEAEILEVDLSTAIPSFDNFTASYSGVDDSLYGLINASYYQD
jgi:hypothetical protein